jgi:hypothetical protein
MEHNRQKISTGVEREKKRLEEAKRTSGGDASPKECGGTAWSKFLFSAIENRNVRERQHVDNRPKRSLSSAWRRLGWSNDGIYISTTSIYWINIRIVLG